MVLFRSVVKKRNTYVKFVIELMRRDGTCVLREARVYILSCMDVTFLSELAVTRVPAVLSSQYM